ARGRAGPLRVRGSEERTARQPPPGARPIAERREAITPRLSRRQAARRAGISPQSWSNVETGRKVITSDITLPWRASAQMLAQMALVLGITPAELEAAGRADAAQIVARIDAARQHEREAAE